MRIRSIAVLASLALVVTACGSDDKVEETTTTAPTTTTVDEHAMEHSENGDHEMEHGEASGSAKPLPLLADGTLDPAGIDLSGVEGVTAEQQAYAEALLLDSINTLPKWADYDVAIKDGFKSIGDGPFTGEEHVIMYQWVNDDVLLDPNFPESLVYRYETGADGKPIRTLEAAMFILPAKFTLETAPTDGGALMQYHNHQNLCFSTGDSPRVAGLTNGEGECAEGLVKGAGNIQIHVWIRANECGPFAALLGVGGGQIKEGETVTCLHDHGSPEV